MPRAEGQGLKGGVRLAPEAVYSGGECATIAIERNDWLVLSTHKSGRPTPAS